MLLETESAKSYKGKKSQVQKVENATIGGHTPHSCIRR